MHLLVCSCGSLANVFLLVMFCTCFYWFVFFKRQEVAYSLLPTPDQERIVRDLVVAAFVLKVRRDRRSAALTLKLKRHRPSAFSSVGAQNSFEQI